MRISDWSSDVCSSDLAAEALAVFAAVAEAHAAPYDRRADAGLVDALADLGLLVAVEAERRDGLALDVLHYLRQPGRHRNRRLTQGGPLAAALHLPIPGADVIGLPANEAGGARGEGAENFQAPALRPGVGAPQHHGGYTKGDAD